MAGYEILGELGRGGMGVVYQARQTKLNRLVALKMILAGSHAGGEELARFRGEAEAIARLQHPHIVQIYEVGEAEGKPFFSLEFVAGGSLAATLDGTPLPARRAAELVQQLAQAMQAAHEHGIIHRDLKPHNVLLTADGQPKVTDFGLAKFLDGAPGALAPGGQTQSESILGTPSYMAPEQAGAKAKAITPATDVYALGAILYELLTGRPPFKAADVLDTLIQVVSEESVLPSRLQPKVSRDLETICLKCLHKEPKKRYDSAQDLADDLGRFLAGEPIRARPVGRLERAAKWVRRRPVVAGLLAVIILLTVTASLLIAWAYGNALAERNRAQDQEKRTRVEWKRAEKEKKRADRKAKDEARERKRAEKEKGRADRKAKDEERERKRAEAEKGKADARSRELRQQLAISQTLLSDKAWDDNNAADALELLDRVPEEYRGFDWHYRRRQFQGGLFTLYGHTSGVSSLAFSPDGRRLASASDDQTVRLWNAHTGQPLLTLQGHTGPVSSVAFSPDGRRLASASQDKMVRLWDAHTGQQVLTLQGHTEQVTSVAFSPDGHRLASASLDETVRLWDAHTGQPLLTLKGHTGLVNSVAFSPDGRRLASTDNTVRLWDAHTGQPLLTLKGHANGVSSVAFSPDGHRLASASRDKMVRLWDAQTGQQVLALKGHTSHVSSVAFSPDGRRLASASQDKMVRLWDALTPEEIRERRWLMRPDPAWHAAEAASAEKAGDWFVAAFHLGRLLRSRPLDLALCRRYAAALQKAGIKWSLAAAYAEGLWYALDLDAWMTAADFRLLALFHERRNEWKEAATAWERVVALEPHLLANWRRLTICRLLAGQPKASRRACVRLLDHWDGIVDPWAKADFAWHCTLAPDLLPDPGRAVRLAEEARAAEPTPYRLRVLGAALYRAGRHAEALQRLEEAVKLQGKGGAVQDWLWLALAHHRLSHGAQARQLLAKASAFLEREKPKTLMQRLEWGLLRQEAEAAIHPQ